MENKFTLRHEPERRDVPAVKELVAMTGFFSDEEILIAGELVEERLEKGVSSGYHFIFAEKDGTLLGYSCFGPIPLTKESHDLYWIAVRPDTQGMGLGRKLLALSEEGIRAMGGKRAYADTSSRDQYLPTRKFYESLGYAEAAFFPDFYAPGDGKVVFWKKV